MEVLKDFEQFCGIIETLRGIQLRGEIWFGRIIGHEGGVGLVFVVVYLHQQHQILFSQQHCVQKSVQ